MDNKRIEKQIQKLRHTADAYKIDGMYYTAKIVEEAADTIEELLIKLEVEQADKKHPRKNIIKSLLSLIER